MLFAFYEIFLTNVVTASYDFSYRCNRSGFLFFIGGGVSRLVTISVQLL